MKADLSPRSTIPDLSPRSAIPDLSPRSAVRTQGFIQLISRDEAREEEEHRPGCKKMLFRCSRKVNEDASLISSPVKDVIIPTLWDHREWSSSSNMDNLHKVSEMPPLTVDKFVKNMAEIMQSHEDQKLAWAVECGNRVVEYLDNIVIEQARILSNTAFKKFVAERPSYMQLFRYLLKNWMPNFYKEIEKLLASVELQACKELSVAEEFPSDPEDMRIQMLWMSEAKDLRDSRMHMGFREGGNQMLQKVDRVEKFAEISELHETVLKAAGILAGGIHILREKRIKKEIQLKNQATARILNFGKESTSPLDKKRTLELSINVVDWAMDSLLLVGSAKELGDWDLHKALPLFPSQKGWIRKVKVDYDFSTRNNIQCKLVMKRADGGYAWGPEFSLSSEKPAINLRWIEKEGREEPISE